jgi:16S rRNA (guanine527-N7)-methyltransferase
VTGATRQALKDRAAYHHVELSDGLLDPLVVYFDLLQRWNRTINLTALGDSVEGLDRLLLEPVAAANYLPRGKRLLDVGSGGGSPAIPLALATGAAHLGMVESRARKAAFLRETIRQLHLQAEVHTERLETLCLGEGFARAWDVVSVRGIRVDSPLLAAVSAAISPDGTLALFASGPVGLPAPFKARTPVRLLRGMESYLVSASAG